jgi:chemotaxis protein CheD
MRNVKLKTTYVGMSDMVVATKGNVLRSVGIGSCLVITLYDPVHRVGALAHSMMVKPKAPDPSRPLRYVGPSIEEMVKVLEKKGVSKQQLEAKLIGGASMFKVFEKNPNSIGRQNVRAAKRKLMQEGIKIISNDTGGTVGRSVTFDLNTGNVEVETNI